MNANLLCVTYHYLSRVAFRCCPNVVTISLNRPATLDRQYEPDIVPMLKAHAGRGPPNNGKRDEGRRWIDNWDNIGIHYWGDKEHLSWSNIEKLF